MTFFMTNPGNLFLFYLQTFLSSFLPAHYEVWLQARARGYYVNYVIRFRLNYLMCLMFFLQENYSVASRMPQNAPRALKHFCGVATIFCIYKGNSEKGK